MKFFKKDNLSLEGHFWICSTPDHKVPGWLVIEENKVELVYWTALHRPRYLDFPEDSSCRILGELKGRGPITLDGCYHMGNPIPFPPKQFTDAAKKDKLENATNIDEYLEAINIPVYVSDRRVHVGRVFLGYHFEENSPISLDTLTFSIEGLDEWVRVYNDWLWECRDISILSVSRSLFSEEEKDFAGFQVSLDMSPRWSVYGFSDLKLDSRDKAYFHLKGEGKSLREFLSKAEFLVWLLCLTTGRIMSVEEVFLRSKNYSVVGFYDKYNMPGLSSEDKPDAGMLFHFRGARTFKGIEEDFAERLEKWFAFCTTHRNFLKSFWTRQWRESGGFASLEADFLVLFSDLEKYVKASGLGAKIEDLFKEFEASRWRKRFFECDFLQENSAKWFMGSVVETRNFLQHGDNRPNTKKERKEGEIVQAVEGQLTLLDKLEAFCMILMLSHGLGFNCDEIDGMLGYESEGVLGPYGGLEGQVGDILRKRLEGRYWRSFNPVGWTE